MTEKTEFADAWNDLRRVADQLKLEIHLGGMEAKAQWEKLQPKLAELERTFEAGAQKAGQAISEQASHLAASFRSLLADVTKAKAEPAKMAEPGATPDKPKL